MLITGTPLQNNLRELWALLNFLLPEVFGTAERFEEWFGSGETAGGADGEGEATTVSKLHKLLGPFLLRRLKADVEKGLPPKKETILKIGLTPMQRRYYAGLLQRDLDAVASAGSGGGGDRSRLLNIVMQLRKCCNHPYLFQGAEPGPPFATGDHIVTNSGKMVLLDRLLPKLMKRGSRVLLFSQMTRLLDILEDYLAWRGYKYCRIDGGTSGEDREEMIDAYNKPGSDKFVFLLSTRAGGLGINLVTADTVILYDSDWNPQMDLQAMDRAHRIGQTREVQVFRFCTEGSVEEKVIEKAYKKLRLDALIVQQGRMAGATRGVARDELLNMVRYGAERIFKANEAGEGGGPADLTDDDLEALLRKGESDTKALNERMQEFARGAVQFSLAQGTDGMEYAYDYRAADDDEGDEGLAERLKKAATSSWVEPAKRAARKQSTYSEAEYFRSVIGGGGGGPRKRDATLVKRAPMYDWQFGDRARVSALYDKEEAHLKYQQTTRERAEAIRRTVQGRTEAEAELEAQVRGRESVRVDGRLCPPLRPSATATLLIHRSHSRPSTPSSSPSSRRSRPSERPAWRPRLHP